MISASSKLFLILLSFQVCLHNLLVRLDSGIPWGGPLDMQGQRSASVVIPELLNLSVLFFLSLGTSLV